MKTQRLALVMLGTKLMNLRKSFRCNRILWLVEDHLVPILLSQGRWTQRRWRACWIQMWLRKEWRISKHKWEKCRERLTTSKVIWNQDSKTWWCKMRPKSGTCQLRWPLNWKNIIRKELVLNKILMTKSARYQATIRPESSSSSVLVDLLSTVSSQRIFENSKLKENN